MIILLLITLKSAVSYAKLEVINSYDGDKVTAEGVVCSTDYYGDANRYEIEIRESNTKRLNGTKASVLYSKKALYVGDTVKFYGTLHCLDTKSAAYQYSNSVFSSVTVNELTADKTQNSFYKFTEGIRAKIRGILFKNTSFDTAATLNALLIGDKSFLSAEYEKAVKRSGVSHMLVVSGMHMTIICGTAFKVLSTVLLSRKLSAAVTLFIGLAFMAICGFTPSVIRAGIMYMVMLSSVFLLKYGDSLNSLCFSVVILIFVNPFITRNIGFQLSVFATAGILLLNEPLTDKIGGRHNNKLIRSLISTVTVTLSATVATLPIVIYYFRGISLVAVLTNLLISFSMNGALMSAILGVGAFLLPFGETLCKPIFTVCEIAVKYSNSVIYLLGNFKYSYLDLEPIFKFFEGIGG